MRVNHVRRRDFITLVGGAAAAWPLAARAQQPAMPAMPVIGFLGSATPDAQTAYVTAFRKGLAEVGYVEGQNVLIKYRWANNDSNRLPILATDLVRQQVAVIVTSGGDPPTLAAKTATATIPIVFSTGADPMKLGIVASFNRPGGNMTGVSFLSAELEVKRLELLRELVPTAATIAFLVNPQTQSTPARTTEMLSTARAIGQKVIVLNASGESDFDKAFAALVQQKIGALLVAGDALFRSRLNELVALAARHAVPASYNWREFAQAGGLMSYGTSLADAHRLVGIYTGRILKGDKPADLPVQQSTKVELIINLKTAKTLGLAVPTALLVRADEVIE